MPAESPEEDTIEIANEYAHVEIHRKQTRNGERIVIRSPKLETEIELDPLQVESLTWQDEAVFTEFLSVPFGFRRKRDEDH